MYNVFQALRKVDQIDTNNICFKGPDTPSFEKSHIIAILEAANLIDIIKANPVTIKLKNTSPKFINENELWKYLKKSVPKNSLISTPQKRVENKISKWHDEKVVYESLGSIAKEIDEIHNRNLRKTEKKALIDARIGQGRFRIEVLKLWNSSCPITGASLFLTASHIKPWKESNDKEKLDPYNGLPLSPTYDKSFDSGLISFDNSGTIIISEDFSESEANKLGISTNDLIKGGLKKENIPYLKYHRENIFCG